MEYLFLNQQDDDDEGGAPVETFNLLKEDAGIILKEDAGNIQLESAP